ncbi:hypothetical protein, partial [Poseidonibacter sp.]|uniref:hypothetical protein n=1 Tax=Poseidonibacter sp. TaxID=2321188 RepID=UPI003C745BE2
MDITDTYFLSANEALKIAQMQNRSRDGYTLQICYYEGEKIESDLNNLIYLPLENFIPILINSNLRLPSALSFSGLHVTEESKNEISNQIINALNLVRERRIANNEKFASEIKNFKLNFNDPLRFHLLAHSATKVMSKVSFNIKEILDEMGYEVFIDIDHGCNETRNLAEVAKFQPHVMITINHINNQLINKDAYNFVWIQDFFALEQFKLTQLRKKDYVLSLIPKIDDDLKLLNIDFQRQSFCLNKNIFKLYDNIDREKKIVFIGSAYIENILEVEKYNDILNELNISFINGVSFSNEYIKQISQKYCLDFKYVEETLIHCVVRDTSVLELCRMN